MTWFHNRNCCWIVIYFRTLLDMGFRLTCLGGIRRVPSHPFLGRDKMVLEPQVHRSHVYTSRVYVESQESVRRRLYLSLRGYKDY